MNNLPKHSYFTGRDLATLSPTELHAEVSLAVKAIHFALLGCLASPLLASLALYLLLP